MIFSAQNPPKNVKTVSEHEWQRAARSEENRLKQCFSTWGSQEDFLAGEFMTWGYLTGKRLRI